MRSPENRYEHPWSEAARWYAILGLPDDAFAALDTGFVYHDYPMLFCNLDPGFAGLRSDPRYQALRRRMRLPA
jgi:hypothetical protein